MAKGIGCVCGGLVVRLWKERLYEKKETFGSDDYVHSLDCDDAFKDIYMC